MTVSDYMRGINPSYISAMAEKIIFKIRSVDMNKNLQSLEWLTLKEVKDRRKTIASHYDYYTDYIDSWKQQQEALANNKRISEDLKKIDVIIKEMEEVEKELKEKGINAELRYSKGRMRIVYQGRVLFRNIKFK
jgi:hypothetical protein